jgi:hypothetical protein
MGTDSEGDEGLELSEDSLLTLASNGDDDNAADPILYGDGYGVAFAGGELMVDEQAVVEELAGGIGSRTQSRVPTKTYLVDANGGIGIMAPEQL